MQAATCHTLVAEPRHSLAKFRATKYEQLVPGHVVVYMMQHCTYVRLQKKKAFTKLVSSFYVQKCFVAKLCFKLISALTKPKWRR